MCDLVNPNRGSQLRKDQPPIADTQAEPTREVSVKHLHIALSGPDKGEQSLEDTHGGWLVEAANIGSGLILDLPENRPLSGQNRREFLPWECPCRRAAGARLPSERRSLFLGYGLVVFRCCGDGAGNRIEQHELQETYCRVNLGGSEAFYKIVGMLLVWRSSHPSPPTRF
jgi:hypothetical protein